MTFRNRTSLYDIGCALYLYFSGLSTRSVAKKALYFLNIEDIFQSGNGFRNTVQRGSQPTKEKRVTNLL